jgi:hypothetical protein
MTQAEKIKAHRELIAFLKSQLARQAEEGRKRVEAVKAEEQQKLKLAYSKARLSAKASAERNLPPGYLMNSDTMIPELGGSY